MKNSSLTSSGHSMALGLGIIVFGVGLFLRQLGIFPPELAHIILSWPMFIFLAGVFLLVRGENRTMGLVVTILGVLMMLPRIPGFPFSLHEFLFPAGLIGVGILILSRHRRPNAAIPPFQSFSSQDLDENFLIENNIFGGSNKVITSKNLKGGRLTSIFGGSELNFTQASTGPEPVVFEVLFIFGGSTFIVPADWTIHLEVTNIFGGFSQKHFREGAENPSKQVFFKGIVLFGGGEIKRF